MSAAWERRAADRWRRFGPVLSPATGIVVDEVSVGPSGIHAVFRSRCGLDAVTDEVLARGCVEAADEIARTLPPRHRQVRAVLLLVDAVETGREEGDVLVVSPDTWHHLTRRSPLRLSTSEVATVGPWLEHHLAPAPVTDATRHRSRRVAVLAVAGLATVAAVAVGVGIAGGWPL